MRIRITRPGIYGADGPTPIGTEMDFTNPPRGWLGKYEVVGEGKTAVTNPAKGAIQHPLDHDNDGKPGGSVPTQERGLDDLRAQYEELFGEAPDGRWGEKRLNDEINSKLAG